MFLEMKISKIKRIIELTVMITVNYFRTSMRVEFCSRIQVLVLILYSVLVLEYRTSMQYSVMFSHLTVFCGDDSLCTENAGQNVLGTNSLFCKILSKSQKRTWYLGH